MISIEESVLELKSLRKTQSSFKFEEQIIWLESILCKRFKTKKQLAKYLNISPRPQERWTVQYIEHRIQGLLSDARKNLKSRIITKEIHQGLEKKVNSSTNPSLGYWDIQEGVFQQYGVEVKYHLLRHYLIKHFKTKPKSPRKSHYKKDEQAEKAFLKTP